MTSHELGELVECWVDTVLNGGDLEAMHDFLSYDFIDHSMLLPLQRGPESYQQYIMMLRAAFPDIHFTLQDLVVDGGAVDGARLTVKWAATATHVGRFVGLPPTGRRIGYSGFTTVCVRPHTCKIYELWTTLDEKDLVQHLETIRICYGR